MEINSGLIVWTAYNIYLTLSEGLNFDNKR